jgi:hypothetical protein
MTANLVSDSISSENTSLNHFPYASHKNIFDTLVIGETDSPASRGLQYFSALNK